MFSLIAELKNAEVQIHSALDRIWIHSKLDMIRILSELDRIRILSEVDRIRILSELDKIRILSEMDRIRIRLRTPWDQNLTLLVKWYLCSYIMLFLYVFFNGYFEINEVGLKYKVIFVFEHHRDNNTRVAK